ncbi:MAG: hypothetical protein Q4A21_01095 [bacterium]|nr:hypothetical protein [bacterium]
MRQPVFDLAKMIAEALNRPYEQDLIIKNINKKAKNMPINEFFKESDFIINPPHYKTSILIIDDTYGQGKTLKAVSELLRKHQNIEKIYFISMVKNLGKGLLGR